MMAIDDMMLIENKSQMEMDDDTFNQYYNELIAASERGTLFWRSVAKLLPLVNTKDEEEVDRAVDQMLERWKNSTDKVYGAQDWNDLRALCIKIYYHREEHRDTLSRGIWRVLRNNIL